MLYPAPLRDLLMHLALSDLFRAKWTDAIHDEWIRSLLIDRPDLKAEQLERTRGLMNAQSRSEAQGERTSHCVFLALSIHNVRQRLRDREGV